MLPHAVVMIMLSVAIHLATKWRTKAAHINASNEKPSKTQGHETEDARATVEEVTPVPESATSVEPESNP